MDTTDIRHDFKLNFLTNGGIVMTLNIPHANPDADGDQVGTAMQAIIDTGIVESSRGTPQFLYSANLVETTSTDFNILV